jgi:hypothetical protein
MRKGRSSRRGRITRTLVGSTLPPPVNPESGPSEPPNPRIVLGVSPSGRPVELPGGSSELTIPRAPITPSPIVLASPVCEPAPSLRTEPPAAAAEEQTGELPRNDDASPTDAEAPPDAPRVDEPEPQEESVPPAGDVTVDEAFFSEGDLQRHLDASGDIDDDTEDDDPLDPVRRKSLASVRARRERFGRYVGWAVAGASAVCLVALLLPKLQRVSGTTPAPASVTRMEQGDRAQQSATATSALVAPPSPIVSAALLSVPVASAVPALSAAPAASASSPEPQPAASAPADTGDARAEKAKAQKALERGKLAEAIEAGERSVKLDPTDSEAWLLLGASYQEKGKMPEAQRAYAACVKEGKTPARAECAKMLPKR